MKYSFPATAASAMLAFTMVLPGVASAASPKAKTVDTACMATAVGTRDTAISTALSTVVTALQTRGTALTAAWGNTDPKVRAAAVKAANTAFNGAWKTFNTARKAAWTQYRTAAKVCHSTTVDSPSDASGSM